MEWRWKEKKKGKKREQEHWLSGEAIVIWNGFDF